MTAIENYIVKYCVSEGNGLGRVKNKKSTLKRLKDMLVEPMLDTSVTFAQYVALDQDAKLIKKSAPGYWLAAHFTDGRRKLTHQLFRSMIVLDLDYIKVSQLDYIRMGFAGINQYYYIMHTTRAHCPERPRVRVIIPADREMDATETNAITRLLSLQLADDPDEAIEIPDLVSFRYNQAMFKPSISRGQEYWMEDNESGVILDVDAFLEAHPGWDDYTLLPYQEAEKQRGVSDPEKKMENPRDKAGILGAWCRTYDIEDAIASFLSDIYEPGTSETETRYSYSPGSGSNGAVVYDDGLFLHSNHGTDPAEGLHNSFDLVRLHLYGHLDSKSPANTSPGNLPSFKAMKTFAEADVAVNAELYAHMADEFDEDEDGEDEPEAPAPKPKPKPKKATDLDDLLGPPPGDDDDEDDGPENPADMFDAEEGEDDPEDDPPKSSKKTKKKSDMSWTANFRRKANGELEPVLNNITLICENDTRLASAIGYNEFTMDPVCLKQIRASKIALPSSRLNAREKKVGRKWEDADDASIKLLTSANEARHGFETDFAAQAVQDAVLIAGRKNRIHPVKNFITGHWETWKANGSQTGFIEQLAQTYLGCPDTIFHRESSRMFLIAAVARIYEPGCKFDQILVLQGPTGGGKSTFLRHLAGEFFSEFAVDIEKTDRTVEAMRGNWFLEVAEFAKVKGDNNMLKNFLSSASDTIRLAYGKREITFPRQSVMTASSNDDDYLSDPTSVRRFWVWITKTCRALKIDQTLLMANLSNIWGEAYQAYLDMRAAQPDGELWLDLHTEEAVAEQESIAEGSRKQTATEQIAEVIETWLDSRHLAHEVILGDDGFAVVDGDERVMQRNMVTPRDAFEAVRNDIALVPYRHADTRTYGKALKMIPGWTELQKCNRHGQKSVWFYRVYDGPEWLEEGQTTRPERTTAADLLG